MPELAEFAGRWAVARRIEDRRAGQVVHFTGWAAFRPDAAGLIYDEEGTLDVPGQAPMAATRRYLWQSAPGGIDVFFADGRFFHAIAPGHTPCARHDCPPDTYDVSYDFTAWPTWRAVWNVIGPRKDYRMITDYSPLGACTGRCAGAEGSERLQRE
ncbi:DUF6314 family protein [Rhodovulum adriaticum]|uniref:DUF6314 domain-containing protein n=1 Tax=Rhodovulum adriaticum TaxID=35804 RepID=A0A4R2NVD3_RHOAD|nr:DUF6314 family protein [Rhodovulum adriaticum]TCP25504.1 hypothetical protein EV656_103257 [Rhodovulum adriaticum]